MSTTNTNREERPFVKHELQMNNVTLKAKTCPVLLKCVTSSLIRAMSSWLGARGDVGRQRKLMEWLGCTKEENI